METPMQELTIKQQKMKKVLCLIGIHKWIVIKYEIYVDKYECKHCKKIKWR